MRRSFEREGQVVFEGLSVILAGKSVVGLTYHSERRFYSNSKNIFIYMFKICFSHACPDGFRSSYILRNELGVIRFS